MNADDIPGNNVPGNDLPGNDILGDDARGSTEAGSGGHPSRRARQHRRSDPRWQRAYARLLAATRSAVQMYELGPWAGRETVTEIRAAADVATALALYQSWPDADHGLSVGILADVPALDDSSETTVPTWYTESLTRILVRAVAESTAPEQVDEHEQSAVSEQNAVSERGAGPDVGDAIGADRYRIAVVLADGRPPHPSERGRVSPPLGQASAHHRRPDPYWPGGGIGDGVAASLARGIARASRSAGLAGRGVRLFVLITDACRVLDDAAPLRLRRLLHRGCAVLVVYLDLGGVPDVPAPVDGAVALTLDPGTPIPANMVALAALDALARIDPAARSL